MVSFSGSWRDEKGSADCCLESAEGINTDVYQEMGDFELELGRM